MFTTGSICKQFSSCIFYVSLYKHSIRGRLCTFSLLFRNIGVLVAFIVNAVVDYEYVPCIFIFIPFVYAVLFMLLPNTPQYYLRKNQDQVSLTIFFLNFDYVND